MDPHNGVRHATHKIKEDKRRQAFPLDSEVTYESDGTPVYDRAVTSEPLRKMLNSIMTDGVLPNPSTNMQVTAVADGGMTVRVLPGFAICNGCMAYETEQRTLAVQASSATYDRIDTVVLRLDDNTDVRRCDLYIVEGIPSANPSAPELTRTSSVYEIGLANIFIAKNTTAIPTSRITDTRYDSTRCGIISAIAEFDTTTLYNQIQADLAEFKAQDEAAFEEWRIRNEAEWMEWFKHLQDVLDDDTAGHLQNEIEALQRALANIKLIHLIISYDPELAGNNITARNGSETYTVRANTQGKTIIDGMGLGTWTVTTEYEGTESQEEVTTEFYGNYKIELKLPGRYNYEEWLAAAGVTKTFASLEAVLADEKTLRTLFTKHASVDYLCEWVSSDAEIASQILGTDLVAKWVNLRDYALDKLYEVAKDLMDSLGKYGFGEWVEIDGTWQPKGLVPIMTSNNAPYGGCIGTPYASQYDNYKAFDDNNNTWWTNSGNPVGSWLGYKFTNPIKVNAVYIKNGDGVNIRVKQFKVQGSNDSNTWNDIATIDRDTNSGVKYNFENDNYYLSYRIYITQSEIGSGANADIYTLQFYGRSLNVSVPTMTSNTEPWGEVKGSGEYSADFAKWKAFNGVDTNNGWLPSSADTFGNAYIEYDFKSETKLGMVSLINYYTDQSSLGTVFKLQGLSDGTWEDIKSGINIANRNTRYLIAIDTTKTYECYRLVMVSSASGSVYSGKGWHINFYGLDYSEREFAQGSTIKYLYDHGLELGATKGTTTILGTLDTTSYKLLRATDTAKASTSDKLKCGSANANVNGLPSNNYLDISSVNGNNETGFSVIQSGNADNVSLWLE